MMMNSHEHEALLAQWRADFPILSERAACGQPLVYLDSAATSQKPQVVLDTLLQFYATQNANVHRGVYALSERATQAYEDSRARLARFIGSQYPDVLVLTHGATESVNLVAHGYFAPRLQAGDEIILTVMEHHANIVPWQMLAEQLQLRVHYVPLHHDGSLDMAAYADLLNANTRLVAVTHVSNVLGTINPVAEITKMAHAAGALVLIDGAQACPQIPVDVTAIDCDFYVASSHKCYAPSGVGLLYARPTLLDAMQPYQTGGSVIETVTLEKTTFLPPPMRFEAGTPAIAEAIAWAKACDYLSSIDFTAALAHKQQLLSDLHAGLAEFKQIRVHGQADAKVPIAAFTHTAIHPHDMATILDSEGVAVRAGHHCAMPLHHYLGISASTRASLAFYNDQSDIQALLRAIAKAEAIFS